MFKTYYKAAIIIYILQLFLLTVMINNNLMARFHFFQRGNWVFLELVLGILIFLMTISSIFVIRSFYVSSIKNQQYTVERLKYQHTEEQNRIYRQHRHDINNHFTIISGLAQMGELDRLKQYLATYLSELKSTLESVDTGLQELDILLFSKIATANQLEIGIDIACEVRIRCLPKKIINLVSIISNALDNAIEAASQAKRKREVRVMITSDVLDYIFCISNTYDSDIDVESFIKTPGNSSKAAGRSGEGIGIINKTVRSLEGEINYFIEPDRVLLKIELPKHSLEVGDYQLRTGSP